MVWLIANWRIIAVISLLGGIGWLGWHLHTLEDKAAQVASLQAENARLAALPPKIITFNQDFNKGSKNDPSGCLTKPISPDLLKLLK